MKSQLIAPKLCAWCGEPFTPDRYRADRQRFCSVQHARKGGGLKRRGQVVPHLATASQRRAALKIAELVADRFGMLSERERAIFQFAKHHGYERGYSAGMRRKPRSEAA